MNGDAMTPSQIKSEISKLQVIEDEYMNRVAYLQ